MTSVLSSISRSSRTASLRTNAFDFAFATKRTFSYRSCVRNVTHEQQQQYRAKQTSRLTPTTILLGVTPILTFALGTWQIQRLKWKVDLIDELQEKLQRPPMVLPDFVNLDVLDQFAFRKVSVKGHWDHAHTVFIGPRVREGTKGVNVITPLIRTDGSTILVDRGFVSDEEAKLERWTNLPNDSEEIQINGMLRTSQKRNYFTPDNHPEKGEWYWVDVNALAEYAGGETTGVQPVFIEAIFEGHSGDAQLNLSRGIPVGRAPTVEVRNSHAAYVFTWYSLSALTTAMFITLLRKRSRAPTVRMPRR